MAMSRRASRELRMLRELAHYYLPLHTCMLCNQALMPSELATEKLGHSTPTPVKVQTTIHHVDGNHENNAPSNRAVVHRVCHKRHHARDGKQLGGTTKVA